jgi:hypothetical protein
VKLSRAFFNLLAMTMEAPPMRRVSLANWEWFILFVPQAILIPGMYLEASTFSSCLPRVSAIII